MLVKRETIMGLERLVKSMLASSLEWSETEERAIDRTAALGLASKNEEIGELMVRVDALQQSSIRRVVRIVSFRVSQKYGLGFNFARRLAIAALQENLRVNCVHCGGKGHQFEGKILKDCEWCNGTGRHRYSNADRHALVGGGYNQKAYEMALALMRDSLINITRQANKRLEDQ
jgi:hypothetical protein